MKARLPGNKAALTEKLLVFGLEGGSTGLQLVTAASVHLILLLSLTEAVDGVAEKGLALSELSPDVDNVVV